MPQLGHGALALANEMYVRVTELWCRSLGDSSPASPSSSSPCSVNGRSGAPAAILDKRHNPERADWRAAESHQLGVPTTITPGSQLSASRLLFT